MDPNSAELTKCLQQPEIPFDADPLKWWKTYSTQFPVIGLLSKKYLCISAPSVPTESVSQLRW